MVEISGGRPPIGDAASESSELERLVEDLVADLDVIERRADGLDEGEDAPVRAIPEVPHLPIAADGWPEFDRFAPTVVPDAVSHPVEVERVVEGLDDEFLRATADGPNPVEVEGLRLDAPLEREAPRPIELERVVEEVDDSRADWSTATVNPADTEIPAEPEPRRDPEEPFETFDHGKRPRPGVLTFGVAIAAVLAVAFAILVVRAGDDGDGANVSTSESVSIDLEPISIGPDVDVGTAWTLTGVDGELFRATLTFRNRSSSPMRATFQEVIPKSLAYSVRKMEFLGPQPRVIERDPVVEYVVDLPPQTDIARQYEIPVAPNGHERSRLEEWKDDLARESTPRTGSVTAPVGPVPTFPPVNPEPPSTAGSGGRASATTGRDRTRGSRRDEPGPSTDAPGPGGQGVVDTTITAPPSVGGSTTSSLAPTTTTTTTSTTRPPPTTQPPPPPTTQPPPPPTTQPPTTLPPTTLPPTT